MGKCTMLKDIFVLHFYHCGKLRGNFDDTLLLLVSSVSGGCVVVVAVAVAVAVVAVSCEY